MRLLPMIAAAIAMMVIGFLWYSPLLFANPWMRAMGYDPNDKEKLKEMQKGAGPLYASAFVASVISAFALHVFAHQMQITTAPAGLQLGLWCWAGFVATVQFTDAIFGKRGRTLLIINSGYQLVSYLAMGAIIGGWNPAEHM